MKYLAVFIINFFVFSCQETCDDTKNGANESTCSLQDKDSQQDVEESSLEESSLEDNNLEENNLEENNLEENSQEYSDLELFFERPPFIIIASLNKDSTTAIVGLHAKPDMAVEEVNQLDSIVSSITESHSPSNFILLGDFNLGCSYANEQELESLDIRVDTDFIWHIKDTDDTNVAPSQCAYDRIITKGMTSPEIKGSVDRRSINHSDHFPVELNVGNLKIGAFNIKQFGMTKLTNQPAVVEIINVICDYDLILLQEIRGQKSPSEELKAKVNSICPNFEYLESAPLGTTSYKERYVYFFRPEKINILDHFIAGKPGDAEHQPETPSIISPQASQPISCCKVCKTSKPCGDSCIQSSKNCTKTSGCACLWMENIEFLLDAPIESNAFPE